ncbi:hypothetical protein M405DRAFT_809450 [Rhizopogon salebrosus TDB-379]|nr:hypothetical protein M405DRAFT_809450 [Rhizopogon salebrosus TDB-379]
MNRWYPAAVRVTTVRASLLTLLSFSIEDSPPVAMHVQGPTANGLTVHGSKNPVVAVCEFRSLIRNEIRRSSRTECWLKMQMTEYSLFWYVKRIRVEVRTIGPKKTIILER